MVTKSDFPKTTRYRGKVYATSSNLFFPTKAKANAYIKKGDKYHVRGINFFTVIKEYGEGKDKFFAIYWRGVYSKANIRKRAKDSGWER